ncbi:hypothetical protein CBL_07503 [Carabus blaptoides fortunei]
MAASGISCEHGSWLDQKTPDRSSNYRPLSVRSLIHPKSELLPQGSDAKSARLKFKQRIQATLSIEYLGHIIFVCILLKVMILYAKTIETLHFHTGSSVEKFRGYSKSEFIVVFPTNDHGIVCVHCERSLSYTTKVLAAANYTARSLSQPQPTQAYVSVLLLETFQLNFGELMLPASCSVDYTIAASYGSSISAVTDRNAVPTRHMVCAAAYIKASS